jgi:hypothetical protein
MKIKEEEIKEGELERKSKYPDGYSNFPLGSDISYYAPIVGEINYVEAVLPPLPVEAVPEPLKIINNKSKADELIDIIPIKPALPRKNSNEPIAPPSHQVVSALIDEEQIISSADQNRGRQPASDLAPKNQRDHTGNAREEEKEPAIVVQPSSLLQQIQRDIISFDKIAPQNNGESVNDLLRGLNESY